MSKFKKKPTKAKQQKNNKGIAFYKYMQGLPVVRIKADTLYLPKKIALNIYQFIAKMCVCVYVIVSWSSVY